MSTELHIVCLMREKVREREWYIERERERDSKGGGKILVFSERKRRD